MPAALPAVVLAGDTTADAEQEDRTSERIRARSVLRFITSLKYPKQCGYALGQEVEVRHGERGGIAGLETCGSVWACPTCSAKIAHGRSLEMEQAIGNWVDGDGGSIGMLTLTIRHKRGQKLDDLWDAVSGAWRRFVSCGSYKRLRAQYGVLGYHRTTEVTHGGNGWHVHLHVVYFINGRPDEGASKDFGTRLVSLWRAAVDSEGYEALAQAQDWKVLHGSKEALQGFAGYVHKGIYVEAPRVTTARSVALEVSRADLKIDNKKQSRTPFQILAAIVREVEDSGEILGRESRLWREWERASKGRRQQIWSRGLRSALELDEERTDEELAAAEVVQGDGIVRITAREWRRVFWDGRKHATLLTIIREADSLVSAHMSVVGYLDSLGCGYSTCPELDLSPAVERDWAA